jgi:hypothetical protein
LLTLEKTSIFFLLGEDHENHPPRGVSCVECPACADRSCDQSAGDHSLARGSSPIGRQRANAETCVSLVKKYGDDAQIARGQLTYTSAKADADAVIAGLITILSTGQSPASLSSLQTKLSSGVSGLHEFCGMVSNLVPNTAGQKNVVIGIAKVAVEPLLKMLSDGVSALYNNHRTDDALTRRTIQTQLEAARWPAFSEVKAAQ